MKLGLLTVTRQQSSFICSLSWVGSLTEDTSCFFFLPEQKSLSWLCGLFVCLFTCIHWFNPESRQQRACVNVHGLDYFPDLNSLTYLLLPFWAPHRKNRLLWGKTGEWKTLRSSYQMNGSFNLVCAAAFIKESQDFYEFCIHAFFVAEKSLTAITSRLYYLHPENWEAIYLLYIYRQCCYCRLHPD